MKGATTEKDGNASTAIWHTRLDFLSAGRLGWIIHSEGVFKGFSSLEAAGSAPFFSWSGSQQEAVWGKRKAESYEQHSGTAPLHCTEWPAGGKEAPNKQWEVRITSVYFIFSV